MAKKKEATPGQAEFVTEVTEETAPVIEVTDTNKAPQGFSLIRLKSGKGGIVKVSNKSLPLYDLETWEIIHTNKKK